MNFFTFTCLLTLVFTAVSLTSRNFFAIAEMINQCNTTGLLALTIDDGPAQYTNVAIDALAAKKVKATFHFTTQYLADPNVQSLVQRVAAAGHLVGLRSESTWNLKSMDDETLKSEFTRVAEVMSGFCGYKPKLVRLPYNGYDARVQAAIEAAGFTITVHNIDSYDSTSGTADKVLNAFKLAISLRAKGTGAFIGLQHDAIQGSMTVIPDIIDYAISQGYKLVRLDECVGLGNSTVNATIPAPIPGVSTGNTDGGNTNNGGGNIVIPSISNNGGKDSGTGGGTTNTGNNGSGGTGTNNPPTNTSAAASIFNFTFIQALVAVFVVFALALY